LIRSYLKIEISGKLLQSSLMVKISDAHWDRIRHHFPEENIPDERPGRKPVPARGQTGTWSNRDTHNSYYE
jgi:hypothetical protein